MEQLPDAFYVVDWRGLTHRKEASALLFTLIRGGNVCLISPKVASSGMT